MSMSDIEKLNLKRCKSVAKKFGYGNVIAYLKRCWLTSLEENGLANPPDSAADASPYPVAIQREIEKGI